MSKEKWQFIDILKHPSRWIYRILFRKNELIVKKCNGEYMELMDNSDHPEWEVVTDKQELISVYEHVILDNSLLD